MLKPLESASFDHAKAKRRGVERRREFREEAYSFEMTLTQNKLSSIMQA